MNISQRIAHNETFVIWRKPKESDVFVLTETEGCSCTFKAYPFEGSECGFSISGNKTLVEKRNFIFPDNKDPIINITEDFTNYRSDFQLFHENLNNNSFAKLVLARKIDFTNSQDLDRVFAKMLGLYPDAFCYLMHMGEGVAWLAATPELLFSRNENRLNAMVLAGTNDLGASNSPKDWSSKNREEHQVVLEFIKTVFDKNALEYEVSETKVVTRASVKHLQTDLVGVDNVLNADALAKDMHPTPAVAGLPQETSKQFILENESIDRELYTGYLVLEEGDFADYFVNLRCAKVVKNKATIFVGGGLMKESDLHSEWEETRLKAETMMNCFR